MIYWIGQKVIAFSDGWMCVYMSRYNYIRFKMQIRCFIKKKMHDLVNDCR